MRKFTILVHTSLSFDMSLPLDPEECLHTPEGQAYHEERARRAYLARLAAMEEMQEIHTLRRTSYGR